MSFLTFDPNKNEQRESNPPMERMNLIVHALSTMQNVIGLEIAAQQSQNSRYGKVQKVGKQFFESDWTNFHNQNAAQAIGSSVVPAEQTVRVVPIAEKTILQEDVNIDPFQFDAMAAENKREADNGTNTSTQQDDAVEAELHALIDIETEKGLQNIIDESRKKAFASATPISVAINKIYQGN